MFTPPVPSVARYTIAELARTFFAEKLMVLEAGRTRLPGYKVRYPVAPGTTVTFAEIDTAEVGTPHEEVSVNRRVPNGGREGPASAPAALRVSTSRQGVSV